MVEVSESIGRNEIERLLLGVLEKIADLYRENYSNELVVEYGSLLGSRYDLCIFRIRTKTRKIFGLFPQKSEEKMSLVRIEMDSVEDLRKITVQMNDAFIYPIAKDEIAKFAESNKEANIKEVAYVKNFSASP